MEKFIRKRYIAPMFAILASLLAMMSCSDDAPKQNEDDGWRSKALLCRI